ncbi:cytochrome c-type biogenesis protein CcmG/DsbE, thiol:disulfide oxidoreductase [Pelagibacterium halotolerans B2]|uniref:Cytochrome c-type biogenesis protein CcmG/DsbE, thiol:disulfide oxidoreductase n=1 Tax=Pelagibacterium halotolerans (strain DSM 22347 / JCM 15775 / CGMCC 1.7692 / B2) TaxID=1082931 RepID=G4R706_PELHB|nr:cytochrome c-type biogenesis protein CcmG/DsbE, thiol:disulfide oxidoreductase [Pelagibacterium halotolerans B2]
MKPSVRIGLAVLPLVVLAALLGVFASQMGRSTSFVPSALIDKPVPQFDLASVEGHTQPGFATADLAGNGVVVVNVFASWCVPCRAEHPFLMELADEPVEIFGLNYDDPAENARAFLAELGNPYDRIRAGRDRRVGIEWGVYGVPETFVVDNEGIIRFKHVGPLDQESYENVLLPAITAAQNPA